MNKNSTIFKYCPIIKGKFQLLFLILNLFILSISMSLALDTPTNQIPNNNSVGVDYFTDFEWNKVTDAQRYELQVADNETFAGAIMYNAINPYFTTYDLFTTTTYYWRVRAVSGNQRSNWSETWNFTTCDYNQTPTPQLVSPFDNESNLPQENILTWNFNIYHDLYDIEISTDENFTTIEESKYNTEDFYYYTSALDFGKSYYWRVRANGENGDSEWSVIWKFNTASEGIEVTDPISIFGNISNCINTKATYITTNKSQYVYEWKISGNYEKIDYKNVNKSEIEVTWNQIGNAVITLYRTNTNTNQKDSTLYDVFIKGPEVDLLELYNICGGADVNNTHLYSFRVEEGTEYEFNVLSGQDYEIDFRDSETPNFKEIYITKLTSSVKIEIKMTDLSGCVNTQIVEFFVLPALPTPVISQIDKNLISSITGEYHYWFKDGEFLTETTDHIYTPTESGIYKCAYLDPIYKCLSFNSEPFDFIYNSIENDFNNQTNNTYFINENSIKLFGNFNTVLSPIVGNQNIYEQLNKKQIQFYNLLGEKLDINIENINLTDNYLEFNTSNLTSNSVYIVTLQINNNTFIYKILK